DGEGRGWGWRGTVSVKGSASRSLGGPPPPNGAAKPGVNALVLGGGWGGGSLLSDEPHQQTPTPTPNPSPAGCGLARFRQIKNARTPASRGSVGRGAHRVCGPSALKDQARGRAVGEQSVGVVGDASFGRADPAPAAQDDALGLDQACFRRDGPHE